MLRPRIVNSVVQDCLTRVYGREAILARIEEFLENLRANGACSEVELKAVDAGVRHILYGIVDSSVGLNDAMMRGPIDSETSKVTRV